MCPRLSANYVSCCLPNMAQVSVWAGNLQRQEGHFNSYGDASIPVEYPDENGNFGHSHVLIANIEYAVPDENDPKREVLEFASLMLKERCYIQEFQMVCKKLQKNTRRK